MWLDEYTHLSFCALVMHKAPFSLQLLIFIFIMTNVIFREFFFFLIQICSAVWDPADGVWRRSLILHSDAQKRKMRAMGGLVWGEMEIMFKNSSTSSQSDCVELNCVARN